jgi:hypothetical protein
VIVAEYWCPHHERFEVIEEHEPRDSRPCPTCEAESLYCISAPAIKGSYASTTTTGTSTSERPPGFLSTSAIADGMPTSEYKAALSTRRKERIRAHVRSKI